MIEPHDLFEPRHYEAQRRPLADARTLPAWCCTSEAFHRRERERIDEVVRKYYHRGEVQSTR